VQLQVSLEENLQAVVDAFQAPSNRGTYMRALGRRRAGISFSELRIHEQSRISSFFIGKSGVDSWKMLCPTLFPRRKDAIFWMKKGLSASRLPRKLVLAWNSILAEVINF
jgi:hypothetical protein